MKNFTFIIIVAFWCNLSFAFQQDDAEDLQIANEKIQQLLNDAEVSVNTLDFDNAIEQLNSSELPASIFHLMTNRVNINESRLTNLHRSNYFLV